MITLKNDWLTARFHLDGGELKSLMDAEGTEYLLDDKDHWNYTSPHLFPVIGMLQQGALVHEGRRYPMNRHGLARTCPFTLVASDDQEVRFRLTSDDALLRAFPFPFQLDVRYSLEGPRLTVAFTVTNPGTETLPFALGAHPAFRVPRRPEEAFSSYHLRFPKKEDLLIHPIDVPSGLLAREPVLLQGDVSEIPLDYGLFEKDALVLTKLGSHFVDLVPPACKKVLRLHFEGFPFLGLWTPRPGAPFLCIEPWMGHADFEDFTGEFLDKEDNILLAPGAAHHAAYAMELLED